MSFHYTNYGSFAGELKKYADLRGYVPEYGDSADDFDWPHEGFTADQWDDFVAEAVDATEKAEKALRRWRGGK